MNLTVIHAALDVDAKPVRWASPKKSAGAVGIEIIKYSVQVTVNWDGIRSLNKIIN